MRQQFDILRSSGVHAQFIRYGFAGGLSTIIYALVYLSLTWTLFQNERAAFAVPFAFLTALVIGFFLHSHWSFAGHGTRENSGRQHAKFFMVHCVGLTMNMAFTWVLTAHLGVAEWIALLPAFSVTPLVTFLLQRQWVFS